MKRENEGYWKAEKSKKKRMFYKIELYRNVKYFPKHKKLVKLLLDLEISHS